jgi:glucosylceramidase
MSSLFGPTGLHLNFVRVPIGASDFTRDGQPYTYDDVPPGKTDPKLAHFSIAHDRAYILPELRKVLAMNPGATMLAMPWSPPAWMKINDSLSNVGHTGRLRWSAATALAHYFVKFIDAYAQAGVPIRAVSLQNEPSNPTSYPGLELSEPAEARLINTYLAPALNLAHLGVLIYGNDSGWSTVSAMYARMVVADRALDRTISGLAWHCYFGSPSLMSALHRADSALDEVVDECSPGITPFPITEAVIGSMRNWASTVAVWNLALDPHGGPVQAPNHGCPGCSGLVTISEQTHTVTYRRSYYQLGQASAFVQPGARRVDSPHFVSYDYPRPAVNVVTAGLDDVAFVNPDGSRVLLAYDNSAHPISFVVDWHARYVAYTLPAGATVTLIWNRKGR